jgi:hypothetical protein
MAEFLEESRCWKVSGITTAGKFFRAVSLLVPDATHMLLEGSPHPEIEALWIDAADRADYAAPVGTIWSWPQKERRFSIPASSDLFIRLADVAAVHSEDEICSHLHFYRGQEALVQWFDAFSVPLLVSKAVAREVVETFASAVGGVVSDGAV